MSTAIIIPARLKAQRLPNKPLALIHDKPMILWVYEQAKKVNVGDVYVATCSHEIVQLIEQAGGTAILTDPDLPSGTDRVYAALESIEKTYDTVVNLQGDLPFIDPDLISRVLDTLQWGADIATLCAPIHEEEDIVNPAVVKPVLSFMPNGYANALYFSRSAVPYGALQYYHHIGIYAFKTQALKQFVALPPSALEKIEKLEQLRALENGMTIHAAVVDHIPLSIDTPQDLEKARRHPITRK
ncbi:MAG: 3-deoxy-manno-octulosonate cytidylyltransferase [Holosporales bacterium]